MDTYEEATVFRDDAMSPSLLDSILIPREFCDQISLLSAT